MERASAKNSSAKAGRAVLAQSYILSQSFKVGFLTVRWYSLAFIAGIASAYFISRWRAAKEGISAKIFDDVAFWIVIIGFISARIYYVFFYFDQYKNNLSEIYKVWHGGLAIYGGLIGGLLALYFLTKKYALSFWKIADVIVLGLPVAQAIGRVGNFFNYEAFGRPTNLPWKMFVPEQFRPPGYQNNQYFHPTFAYEIIWNLLVFGALMLLLRRKLKPGILTACYLLLYSIGRFAIEAIRLDSAFFGPFRGDQITALLLIFAALAIIMSRYVPQNSR